MKESFRNNDIEKEIFILMKKIYNKKLIILGVSLIATLVVYLHSAYFITPQYESTTKMYVVPNNENANVTTQDLQLGNYLINDYKYVITSRDVLEEVIDEEDLNMSIGDLKKSIAVSIPQNTRIIEITVMNKNPKLAKKIATTLRASSIEKIKDITRVKDVTVLEKANVSLKASYPNSKKRGLVGGLSVFILSIVFFAFYYLVYDKVSYPEDLENNFDYPILGIVPQRKTKKNK